MSRHRYLIGSFLCCNFIVFALSAQDCKNSRCKGPIRHYEELGCKPNIKEGDCCAVSYDCTHLDGRSADKCYVNGHEYKIGDSLLDKDRSGPCDTSCMCEKTSMNVASFLCAQVDCPSISVNESCIFKRDLKTCCGGEEVCPKNNEKTKTCNVNGIIHPYGDVFYLNNHREMCQCLESPNNDKQMDKICVSVSCGIELRRSNELHANCSPVFFRDQLPSQACSYEYKCQSKSDLIDSFSNGTDNNSSHVSDDMKCKLGNMTLYVGDKVREENDAHITCICEVPPMLTCKYLS